jgi:glycosyltransferase involved in cell wall biosynthesis
MKRLVILTEIISPYRIPLFNALAEHKGIRPHVIFLAETDPALRQWQIYKDEIRFSYEVLPSWRRRVGSHNVLLNGGLGRALESAEPDVILCGGYNYPASWQSQSWARLRSIPFLLWSESTSCDSRAGRPWVEFLKTEFLKNCDGFVVPGISSKEYLRSRGHKERSIFTAPNAVDNDLFMRGARSARQNAPQARAELKLPQKYFLFVGRLVREKGVFDLLSAYASLDPQLRAEMALVLVGDGSERRQLEEQARSIAPGRVHFAGFVQRDHLAAYYGLAEMLILPTHTDTWGLVVNEAMACGLPVLVSRAAGCSADLLRDGWNGKEIVPQDVRGIALAMEWLGGRSELCREMGLHSAEHILKYSPHSWCEGVAAAIAGMGVAA